MATVSLDGVQKEVSLALVEDVQIGDYLLVHVGYALNRLSEEEAERTLALMSEAGVLDEELGVNPPIPGSAGGEA
jgi:hydrogenase expression/formation protein HypC